MKDRVLTSSEVDATLVNALHFAADGYQEIARKNETLASEASDHASRVLHRTMADQFLKQFIDAVALADVFAEAETVVVRIDDEPWEVVDNG